MYSIQQRSLVIFLDFPMVYRKLNLSKTGNAEERNSEVHLGNHCCRGKEKVFNMRSVYAFLP
jgi:hypothetical protein